jgi:hypothetical protein
MKHEAISATIMLAFDRWVIQTRYALTEIVQGEALWETGEILAIHS